MSTPDWPWIRPIVSAVAQDIRYALRSLSRARSFTLVALATLALGIGGTTAIFSIVDGVLLRPLPYPDPERILRLTRPSPNGVVLTFSPADYLDVTRAATTLVNVAGYRSDTVDLTGRSEPVRVRGLQTTSAFFDVFNAPPLLGRTYRGATDRPGVAVAVIGERIWRQQFGGEASVIGATVRLNGAPTEIIGVVAESFRHPVPADVWMLSPSEVPVSPLAQEIGLATRDVQYFSAVARLAPSADLTAARQQLAAIAAMVAKEFPATNAGESLDVERLSDNLVSNVRSALFVLLGAIGFVLLIACANVAGLLMARAAARRRELALRTALGAGRRRIVQQLLTESLVLAGAGGALGLLVGTWALRLLVSIAPANLPRLDEVTLDWRVAWFTFAATMTVGVMFGLMPAIQASRPQLTADLKDGGRSGTSRTGARSAMVVAQVALALVLLIGAGLMLTSLSRLQDVEPGFRTSELVAVQLQLPRVRYDEARQQQLYASVLERLQASPVTAQSALAFPVPLTGSNPQTSFRIEGQPGTPGSAELNSVSPGYFQTVGLRLLAGRDFAPADGPNAPPVAIINEEAAREFGSRDPIGARVNLGGPVTVIGIVSNARRVSLDTAPRPAVYMSYTQFVLPVMGVVVRTAGGSAPIATAVKAAVSQFDPDLPIGDVKTIEQIVSESTGQPRFRSFLLASFAGLALLLAAVGVYGLISFTVAQRVPEIGVRLALGATPWRVFNLVIGQGLRLAAIGIALGLIVAAAATRLVQSLLFNTSATDPAIYASLAALLLTMAAVACYAPARRAMRVDPMTALRSE